MGRFLSILVLIFLTAAGQKDSQRTEPSPPPKGEEKTAVQPDLRSERSTRGTERPSGRAASPSRKEVEADKETNPASELTGRLSFPAPAPTPPHLVDLRPVVVALIAPYQGVAKQLAGDHYRVETVLEPGEDLHAFQLRGSVLQLLGEADIYLKMNLAQEESLILPQLPLSAKVVDLSGVVDPFHAEFVHLGEGIDAVLSRKELGGEAVDVHYWLGPDQMLQQLPLISDALAERDPEHRDEYQRRLEEVQQQVERVSSQVTSLLAPLSGQMVVQYHPFLQYFLNNFSLVGLGVEREGREVTLADAESLRRTGDQVLIRTLFITRGNISRSPALLAERLNWRLVELDVFSEDWANSIEEIARAIFAEFLYWQNQGEGRT